MSDRLLPREDVAAIAASLGRFGWKVFPVSVKLDGDKRRKKPLVRFTEVASDDPATIFEWWQANPEAFVGVYTRGSGLVALDIDLSDDPEKDGPTSLGAHGLTAPETLSYATLGGGRHHIYSAPEDRVLTVGANLVHDGEKMGGVDIRSGNGYFVYYGEALAKEPILAPAPDWMLLDGRDHDAKFDLALADWSALLTPGKPGGRVQEAVSLVKEHGTSHATMLEATRLLAQYGHDGEPGVAAAVTQAREVYLRHHPEYAKDFDSALRTSVNFWGPPLTVLDFDAVELPLLDPAPVDYDEEPAMSARDRRIAVEVMRLEERAEADRQFRALQRGARPSFADRLLSRSDLEALPAPEPLIPGVLSKGVTAMLFAPPAGYKSLLAQSVAYSIVTGHQWFGRDVERGRVLYISAEGASGLDRRFKALEAAWGTPIRKGLYVYPDPVDFGNPADVAEVAVAVADLGIDLVVGDTLNRLAPGLEENSATSMGVVVTAADSIRKAHEGCTILLVHHTGHNGNLRGSTALLAGMDMALQLSGDGDVRTLEIAKNKDGEKGKVMELKLSPVDGTDSVILTSAFGSGRTDEETLAPSAEQAYGLFCAAFRSTGATRPQWHKLLIEEGMKARTAYAAIDRLVNSARIVKNGSQYSIGPGLDLDESDLNTPTGKATS